ncbi:MAG: leucine-rich repeat protein, partial [Clostridia bacterium]|nr:leucine-rich repeat protein [Clostridia bacterium]
MKKFSRMFICCLIFSLIAAFALELPSSALAEGLGYQEISYSYKDGAFGKSLASGFVYSDSMLLEDANELSTDVAKASVALAMAAYSSSEINSILANNEKMGYSEVGNSRSSSYNRNININDCDHVAYSIYRKVITDEQGIERVIYCVPVCGTRANSEWISDFNFGDGDDHAGFYAAAQEVYDDLTGRLSGDGYSKSQRIIWLTGHSRGAAVSNIVAGWLTNRGDYAAANHIFGYTFACPFVSKGANTSLNNIYNFNISGDLITTLPLRDWGYRRNGRTIELDAGHKHNFLQRFKAEGGVTYNGMSSNDVWIDALKTVFTSEEAAKKPLSKLVLNILGYALGGKNDSNVWQLITHCNADILFTEADILFNIIKSKLTNTSSIMSATNTLANMTEDYFTLSSFIRDNRSEVAAMDEVEFAAFRSANSAMISRIASSVGYAITSPTDFLDALDDLSIMNSSVVTVYDAISVAADLFLDSNGNPKDAIFHAHTQSAYTLWINSMYYGYRGWYGNTDVIRAAAPANITGIGQGCFRNCSNMAGFSFAGSLKHIGKNAFYGLEKLNMSMQFGGSLEYIGTSAFYGCAGITGDVDLSGGITSIGNYTFYGCVGLEIVEIPDSVTGIGTYAFYNCNGMKSIKLPISAKYVTSSYTTFIGCSSIEAIEYTVGDGSVFEAYENSKSNNYTLAGVSSATLKTMKFGEGVTSLPKRIAYNCAALETIELPETLTMISEYAFYGCSALTEMTIPTGVTSIGASAFSGCSNWAGEFPIWETQTAIGGSAFNGCAKLTGNVKWPEAVTYIGGSTFYGCTSMEIVEIPDSVTGIGSLAFYNCNGMKSIKLPISAK